MKINKLFSLLVILALLLAAMPVMTAGATRTLAVSDGYIPATINTGALNWSVQYLIDQSQTVLGNPQFSRPRDNRGLATSPNGNYLYAGYNNGYNNGTEVRKIDLSQTDYTAATVARTPASRGKAIAVDDMGRVYLADGTAIKILDANLSGVLYTITVTSCEGVAVRREGGTLVLYATDRSNKTLTRWELSESVGTITGATMSGLGGTGQLTITGASSLRGVEVDASGRIWMADISANKVFQINSDGTGLTSVTVASPIDIGFDDTQAYVTQYTARTITVLSQSDMSLVDTLTPPLADLKLAPTGQNGGGALSGIVVTADGFYVANEAGQTADEKSTYGSDDANSGELNGTYYTDLYNDDNDPILKVMIVVPNQPPVADPGGPYLGAINTPISFNGTGSSDPDNNSLTYAWDFGDGSLGTGVSPSHVYTAAGIYDVCLTVNDGTVDSAEVCTYAVVYDPSGGFVTGGGWIDSPAGAVVSIPALVWNQGFEANTDGWLDADSGWYGTVTRVATSTNGIPSAYGSYHATMEGDASSGPFTRFDGYRSVWPGTWTAEIDVYLDPAWANGQGFDYTVAATGSDGNHQRDYIFHVGVVENYGSVTGKALLVNGSNNTDNYANPYKLVNDNGGNYYEVTSAGWYTLQHVFYDAGGFLAVDLNLIDASNIVLWTATRSNIADTIPAEIGGNRYGWFTFINVAGGIAVDEHQLFMPFSPTGKATFGFVSKYKKGASVPDGNTEFQFKAGNLNFSSTSYQWLVVNQAGTNAQFKGYGTINGAGNYGFMLWATDGSPDKFRIQIWDAVTEVVVYDNGTDQPIGGGSIVVHKK